MVNVASTGYTVDDLDWLRDEIGVAHLELDPWGSLIVSPADDPHEIAAATSSGRADRGRKLADYKLGGAEKYLLVDLPRAVPGGGSPPTFELHDFAVGTLIKATGSIEFDVGGQPVRFELP